MGGSILSKFLIQFSVARWGYIPLLLFTCGAVRRYPSPKGKGEGPARGRRDEFEFRIKPHSRDAQRVQTNLVDTKTQGPHRDRTVFECLLWRDGSAVACCRDRDLGAADLGMA